MSKEMAASMEYQAPAQYEPATIMQVISKAASDPTTDVDKLERLMAMYERLEAKKAETAFNEAMSAVQKSTGRIAADANNPQTRSKYASYAALDRVLRPLYTQEGLSISFDTADAPLEGYIRILAYVSHKGGHTRTYHVDMSADGKGAKGGDVMTKTHAAGAGMSYGMRYLLKLIFNVAVGEDDDDGNGDERAVSAEQVANLHALMEEVQADMPKFLKYWKIVKLDELPADKYQQAIKMLESKRRV